MYIHVYIYIYKVKLKQSTNLKNTPSEKENYPYTFRLKRLVRDLIELESYNSTKMLSKLLCNMSESNCTFLFFKNEVLFLAS